MSDLIKRSDAIKALYKYSFVSKDVIEREINAIPTTDRPQGKWIYWREDGIKRCKCARCLTSYGCLDTPYCPNCGAQMEGTDNEN